MSVKTTDRRKRLQWAEIGVVFGLSLGASAVYSIVSLIAKLTAPAGLGGQKSTINPSLAEREWLDLTYQVLGIAFGLMPVALVIYLVATRTSKPFAALGLTRTNLGHQVAVGVGLAAVIGLPGIGLYLAARALGLSAQIVPADLGAHWWVVPVLLLAAVKASVLEEFIVVAYLFNKLEQLKVPAKWQIAISATVRGAYHLYQGFGGFVGNLAMGLLFGYLYKKHGRLLPLLIAHFILDFVAFVGYALLSRYITLP